MKYYGLRPEALKELSFEIIVGVVAMTIGILIIEIIELKERNKK